MTGESHGDEETGYLIRLTGRVREEAERYVLQHARKSVHPTAEKSKLHTTGRRDLPRDARARMQSDNSQRRDLPCESEGFSKRSDE